MKKLIYFITLIIVSCSSVQTENSINDKEMKISANEAVTLEIIDGNEDQLLKKGFNDFYQRFTSTIISKNVKEFNSFIHQNYGLHFIESSGAMPMFNKVYIIENFTDINTNKAFFDLAFREIDKILVNDSLPKIICGGEVYDKYGCFVQKINPLDESQIWNFTDLNDKQKQEIEVIAKTVTYTVVNTANYTFYFSLIEDNWYITFIDLRIPCSA